MNHRITLPLLFLLPALLTACRPSRPAQEADALPVLTVSIEPLRYFTEALAGPHFSVHTLVPQGMSPESYDPTPRQLVELAHSRACLLTGHLGYEQVWRPRLQAAAPRTEFIDLSEGLPLIHTDTCEAGQPDAHTHAHAHAHAHGIEPHIWTSPANASLITTRILHTLCRLDTAHCSYYQSRHDSLQRCIHRIDSLTRRLLQHPRASRSFLIYHPSLTYYAHQYGLHQIAIEAQGKEPTPEALRRLIDRCRKEQAGVIFVQPEFDMRHAELIARHTGTRLEPIHPLAYQWDVEMLRVAQALADSLPPSHP